MTERTESEQSSAERGADSAAEHAPEDSDERRGEGAPAIQGGDDAAEKAKKQAKESEEAKKEVERLEENPPEKLEDWPEGKAKYETFGGPEHQTSYEEAATEKLGPADVRHYEDGTVTVGGEEVDDPDEFKGEPIPGGPTDPDSPKLAGEKDLTEEGKGEDEDDREGGANRP